MAFNVKDAWKRRKRCQLFPWMKNVLEEYSKDLTEVHHSKALQILHENVKKEFQSLSCVENQARAQALYILLSSFFINFCWKISWKKEDCLLKDCCIKLLCYLINLGLHLIEKDSKSKWMNQLLTAFKLIPDDTLLYEGLLLINNLSKKQSIHYKNLLRHVLCKESLPLLSKPETYIKIILLFKRLKMLSHKDRKAAITYIASKIQPPADVVSWLSSLALEELYRVEGSALAQLILSKNIKTCSLKKLRHAVLSEEYLSWMQNLMQFKVQVQPIQTGEIEKRTQLSSKDSKAKKKKKEKPSAAQKKKLKSAKKKKNIIASSTTSNNSEARVENRKRTEKRKKCQKQSETLQNQQVSVHKKVKLRQPNTEDKTDSHNCLSDPRLCEKNEENIEFLTESGVSNAESMLLNETTCTNDADKSNNNSVKANCDESSLDSVQPTVLTFKLTFRSAVNEITLDSVQQSLSSDSATCTKGIDVLSFESVPVSSDQVTFSNETNVPVASNEATCTNRMNESSLASVQQSTVSADEVTITNDVIETSSESNPFQINNDNEFLEMCCSLIDTKTHPFTCEDVTALNYNAEKHLEDKGIQTEEILFNVDNFDKDSFENSGLKNWPPDVVPGESQNNRFLGCTAHADASINCIRRVNPTNSDSYHKKNCSVDSSSKGKISKPRCRNVARKTFPKKSNILSDDGFSNIFNVGNQQTLNSDVEIIGYSHNIDKNTSAKTETASNDHCCGFNENGGFHFTNNGNPQIEPQAKEFGRRSCTNSKTISNNFYKNTGCKMNKRPSSCNCCDKYNDCSCFGFKKSKFNSSSSYKIIHKNKVINLKATNKFARKTFPKPKKNVNPNAQRASVFNNFNQLHINSTSKVQVIDINNKQSISQISSASSHKEVFVSNENHESVSSQNISKICSNTPVALNAEQFEGLNAAQQNHNSCSRPPQVCQPLSYELICERGLMEKIPILIYNVVDRNTKTHQKNDSNVSAKDLEHVRSASSFTRGSSCSCIGQKYQENARTSCTEADNQTSQRNENIFLMNSPRNLSFHSESKVSSDSGVMSDIASNLNSQDNHHSMSINNCSPFQTNPSKEKNECPIRNQRSKAENFNYLGKSFLQTGIAENNHSLNGSLNSMKENHSVQQACLESKMCRISDKSVASQNSVDCALCRGKNTSSKNSELKILNNLNLGYLYPASSISINLGRRCNENHISCAKEMGIKAINFPVRDDINSSLIAEDVIDPAITNSTSNSEDRVCINAVCEQESVNCEISSQNSPEKSKVVETDKNNQMQKSSIEEDDSDTETANGYDSLNAAVRVSADAFTTDSSEFRSPATSNCESLCESSGEETSRKRKVNFKKSKNSTQSKSENAQGAPVVKRAKFKIDSSVGALSSSDEDFIPAKKRKVNSSSSSQSKHAKKHCSQLEMPSLIDLEKKDELPGKEENQENAKQDMPNILDYHDKGYYLRPRNSLAASKKLE